MEEKAWLYGCLFCRTGAEVTIARYINQTMIGIEAVAPLRTRRKNVAGKIIEDQIQLLPGYIFFRTEADERPSHLTHITHVVLSTHSTDFIDAEYLVGLVRVFKENGTTRAVQLTPEKLASFCIESGVPANRINAANVVDFYSTKLFPDQLKGMFAETIILVEGATEYFAIPEFLKRCDYSLAEHGVEIVNCRGKDAIPLFWRLFKAYRFNCYCIFDGDMQAKQNDKLFNGIISSEQWVLVPNEYVVKREYAYFGRDFESYFRASMPEYAEKEQEAIDVYSITSKPGKAKAVAQHCNAVPKFITELKDMLLGIEHHG